MRLGDIDTLSKQLDEMRATGGEDDLAGVILMNKCARAFGLEHDCMRLDIRYRGLYARQRLDHAKQPPPIVAMASQGYETRRSLMSAVNALCRSAREITRRRGRNPELVTLAQLLGALAIVLTSLREVGAPLERIRTRNLISELVLTVPPGLALSAEHRAELVSFALESAELSKDQQERVKEWAALTDTLFFDWEAAYQRLPPQPSN